MITLIIPTKNRPEFLIPLLRYYADSGFKGKILIGESSDSSYLEKNAQGIEALRGKLDVEQVPCPDMTPGACLEKLSGMVMTPYCAYLGDDDFLAVSGLESCAQFLDSHPDYAAANGKSYIIELEGTAGAQRIRRLRHYKQIELNQDLSWQRLRAYFQFRGSSILFCVFRTLVFSTTYKGASQMKVLEKANTIKDELLPACLSALAGKVKNLGCLHMIRRVHQGYYNKPSGLYDQVTRSDWSCAYQFFHERLVEEMTAKDGVSRQEAESVIRQGFWPSLAEGMLAAWHSGLLTNRQASSGWRAFLRNIPGLRASWIKLRLMGFAFDKESVSLIKLLGPFSAHRGNFLPIYKALLARKA